MRLADICHVLGCRYRSSALGTMMEVYEHAWLEGKGLFGFGMVSPASKTEHMDGNNCLMPYPAFGFTVVGNETSGIIAPSPPLPFGTSRSGQPIFVDPPPPRALSNAQSGSY